MTEIIISNVVAIIQIFLSINLIIRRKNKTAILTEIISAILLLGIMNIFFAQANISEWRYIVLVLVEYLCVKIFLVVFMLIARIYFFNMIKNFDDRKKKISEKKLKIIRKFCKAKYWPRLKLGIPSQAGERHSITKVKIDEKGFPKFKAYYTVKLRREDYRKSREQHFYIANKILYKEICSNSKLRKRFSRQEIKNLSQGKTPKKYTWHHHQDAGILQLVEYDIHSKTKHDGGYSIWGSK